MGPENWLLRELGVRGVEILHTKAKKLFFAVLIIITSNCIYIDTTKVYNCKYR